MACEEFFKDGNIPFTTNQVKLSNGETVTVFESTSEYKGAPVKIYNCDLYFMTSKVSREKSFFFF